MRLTSNAKASSPNKKNGIRVILCPSLDGPGKNLDLDLISSFPSLKIPLFDWLPGDPK